MKKICNVDKCNNEVVDEDPNATLCQPCVKWWTELHKSQKQLINAVNKGKLQAKELRAAKRKIAKLSKSVAEQV